MFPTLDRRRHRGSRGVIAMIAGLALLFVVTLSVVMAELGLASLQRFEMHDAAEAVAMAGGYQVLTQPSPNFGGTFPSDSLVADNARASTYNNPSITPHPVPTYAGATATPADAGGKEVAMRGIAGESYMTTGPTPLSGGGNARVVVNQFQVADFTIIPARILLVVDFSRSTRLTYPGGPAAYTVIQEAITTILNDPSLKDRVDWGLLLFSDTLGSQISVIPPGPGGWAASKADLDNQIALVAAGVKTPTFGDGTDLASAINQGISILQSPTGNALYGKNVMIIITDGEPDVVPGASPNTPYSDLVITASGTAQAAAQAAWSNGIETLAILIQRQSNIEDEVVNFMYSIAGDGKVGQPGAPIAHNMGIADAAGKLSLYLSYINPANHCLTATPILPPPGSWMPNPQVSDLMYGYWVPAGTDILTETAVTRAYTVDSMTDPVPGDDGVFPTTGAQFYFNPTTSVVEVNMSICQNFISYRNNGPIFRARYGLPRISWVGSM